ncbi:MAG TPA: PilN domain-containing protein [Legionella sp.]|nr:PilN domain-containing protein [Legionella sp.]
MQSINLLSWRKLERDKKKKHLRVYLFLCIIISLGMVITLNYYLKQLISNQLSRNSILQNEIKLLNDNEGKIKRLMSLNDELINKLLIIKGLQEDRVLSEQLFEELAKVLPKEIYLTELKKEKNIISLLGYSKANSPISSLLARMEHNFGFQGIKVSEITKTNNKLKRMQHQFLLNFNFQPSNQRKGFHAPQI